MLNVVRAASKVSRQKLLAVGAVVIDGGPYVGVVERPTAGVGSSRLAEGRPMGAGDAVTVNASEFMPVEQFRRMARSRSTRSVRRTRRGCGRPAAGAEGYIDDLRDDLERRRRERVRFQRVPMRALDDHRMVARPPRRRRRGPVRTASYIPYSGRTRPGVSPGPLVFVSPGLAGAGLAGRKIAVFDVPLTAVPLSFFTNLGYPAASTTRDDDRSVRPVQAALPEQHHPAAREPRGRGSRRHGRGARLSRRRRRRLVFPL